ncbi:MAG: hypoxanthine phosphoribosyltransferase [Thermonema sp.]|uniref:hypoxanthine phosphoribosyltransferase n=1 Tax=Thermonema sp. TaxID=2231181 RepID=UPI0021DC9322|nr:hypoxanthine phosphoribosyltransferase [Thermonema sp.]GIV39279.1 MAG: hypoxanthine phosphoribosyltransferase [Thermonema sp.]
MKKEVQLHDRHFELFLDAEAIQAKVKALAEQIRKDYDGKPLVLLCVLSGAFRFAADLARYLNDRTEIGFIKVQSYEGMMSSGLVREQLAATVSLSGKHVLLVEDIVDTGTTIRFLVEKIYQKAPASLKIATLLLKPDALKHPVQTDYVGFEIPNHFVVGYGLDYEEQGRCLNDLYVLKA